jgi:hypothetical protein
MKYLSGELSYCDLSSMRVWRLLFNAHARPLSVHRRQGGPLSSMRHLISMHSQHPSRYNQGVSHQPSVFDMLHRLSPSSIWKAEMPDGSPGWALQRVGAGSLVKYHGEMGHWLLETMFFSSYWSTYRQKMEGSCDSQGGRRGV